MKISKIDISILCVLLVLVTGCIDEDRSKCLPTNPYYLSFEYYGDGTTDIFNSKTENVYIYFFDTEGEYVNRYIRYKTDFNTFQGIVPDLPSGQYRVVCWSNISQLSEFTGDRADVKEQFLYNSSYLKNEPIVNFDSLYYGAKTISIPENRSEADTIYFRSAHIKIEVNIEGLSSTIEAEGRAIGDSQGWLQVRNISVGYNFEMQLTGEISDMYPDLATVSEENNLQAKFNLLRFENTNPIVIDIFNGNGKKVYSLSLEKFMSDNDIHVEGINEITIPIYIRFIDDIYVQISVSEWESGIVEPIL